MIIRWGWWGMIRESDKPLMDRDTALRQLRLWVRINLCVSLIPALLGSMLAIGGAHGEGFNIHDEGSWLILVGSTLWFLMSISIRLVMGRHRSTLTPYSRRTILSLIMLVVAFYTVILMVFLLDTTDYGPLPFIIGTFVILMLSSWFWIRTNTFWKVQYPNT